MEMPGKGGDGDKEKENEFIRDLEKLTLSSSGGNNNNTGQDGKGSLTAAEVREAIITYFGSIENAHKIMRNPYALGATIALDFQWDEDETGAIVADIFRVEFAKAESNNNSSSSSSSSNIKESNNNTSSSSSSSNINQIQEEKGSKKDKSKKSTPEDRLNSQMNEVASLIAIALQSADDIRSKTANPQATLMKKLSGAIRGKLRDLLKQFNQMQKEGGGKTENLIPLTDHFLLILKTVLKINPMHPDMKILVLSGFLDQLVSAAGDNCHNMMTGPLIGMLDRL